MTSGAVGHFLGCSPQGFNCEKDCYIVRPIFSPRIILYTIKLNLPVSLGKGAFLGILFPFEIVLWV